MVRPYRFHVIGLIIGLVLLGIMATAEVPEFSLLQYPPGQEDKSLPKKTRAADDRTVEFGATC